MKNGGPTGTNSDYIGIDTVAVQWRVWTNADPRAATARDGYCDGHRDSYSDSTTITNTVADLPTTEAKDSTTSRRFLEPAGCRPTTAPVAGSTNWFQGNNTVFPAQSGAPNSYIGANFNNTTGASPSATGC